MLQNQVNLSLYKKETTYRLCELKNVSLNIKKWRVSIMRRPFVRVTLRSYNTRKLHRKLRKLHYVFL